MKEREEQAMSHYVRMVKDLVKCGMDKDKAISEVTYGYCLSEAKQAELRQKVEG